MNPTIITFDVLALATLAITFPHVTRLLIAMTEALSVKHFPNPTDLHTAPIPKKPPYPFVWYYQTEVTNNLDKPLKIIEFEGYCWVNGHWIGSNILQRPLTTEVFMRWYGPKDGIQDGWLQPGAKAVCDINWHGSNAPYASRVKWVFYAVDAEGTLYEGQGEIVSVPYNVEKKD